MGLARVPGLRLCRVWPTTGRMYVLLRWVMVCVGTTRRISAISLHTIFGPPPLFTGGLVQADSHFRGSHSLGLPCLASGRRPQHAQTRNRQTLFHTNLSSITSTQRRKTNRQIQGRFDTRRARVGATGPILTGAQKPNHHGAQGPDHHGAQRPDSSCTSTSTLPCGRPNCLCGDFISTPNADASLD